MSPVLYSIQWLNETDAPTRHCKESHSFLFHCLCNFKGVFIALLHYFLSKNLSCTFAVHNHAALRDALQQKCEKSDATYWIRQVGATHHHILPLISVTFCDCLTDWRLFDNSLGNFLITTQWWRQLLLSYNVQSMYNYVTNFYSPQTFSQECVFAVYGGKQNWLSHWAIKYCMSESLCHSVYICACP